MRSLRTAILGFALVLPVAGCHSTPRAREHMPGAAVRSTVVPQPTVRGLEMYWWGFDDGGDPAALARKLRQYLANAAPVPQEVLRAWRLNGLRMVSLPMSELPALEEDLHVTGIQRKVLGELTNWGTLASGPTWAGQLRLQMEKGELTLESGKLRMIGRAWTVPQIVEGRDGAAGQILHVMRIELALQHEEQRVGRDGLNFQPVDSAAARSIKDDGLVLSRTIANFDLASNEAVLIFPEPPDADLIELAASRPEPAPANTDAGPSVQRVPTAGELMLSGTVLGTAPARRAIIVLTHAKPPKTE